MCEELCLEYGIAKQLYLVPFMITIFEEVFPEVELRAICLQTLDTLRIQLNTYQRNKGTSIVRAWHVQIQVLTHNWRPWLKVGSEF
ncbi:hypothetical protein C5167_045349 [Papaver somniferum]|uniref:Uncharacterized protein n=1 Tax=Papaver somniferum TaxID=3469 RepID=A0A4Y7LE47_PAPSO|nr:hypothetical protein C5167_045349 [Papaver somniferum]